MGNITISGIGKKNNNKKKNVLSDVPNYKYKYFRM